MDLSDILAFALVAGLLALTPGPNGLLVARTVPTSGKAAGFATVLGIAAAFYLHGALSILGLSVILLHSATLFLVLKIAGAAYLCWIGAKALWAAWTMGTAPTGPVVPATRRRTLARAAAEGFLTNALNPKVALFYLAAFPQFLPAGSDSAWSALGLVVLHSVITTAWLSSLVLFFGRLTAATGSPRFRRWVQAVTGAVFVAFGVHLATWRP
ncbi:LysE family translocator [Roseospira visakhapatnamensis]|uniref:Threonine/homoserine/homoserine lactone efflux protein n=1 Tax=Roseospira visakhapatnamensis TaxID=390880 RepID=A0A7W6R9X4_9PROT|nr:LysE family translocator [Roseospira visakhapatnamensis]MBB4264624.1 threonine/homoserine/homoserine lactone efflux protein [Roseospira visakhapatnamensis]